ncbi:MAG: non-reducing end alpha-L-arabinofuranosidase family hydrolase, partial [Polyangiaceae bacterium]
MPTRSHVALFALVAALVACGPSPETGFSTETDDGGSTTSSGASGSASGGSASGSGASSGSAISSGSSGGPSSSGGSASSGGSSGAIGGSDGGNGSGSGSGSSGGSSSGSSSGSTGDGRVCALPTKFKWTSTGPLAQSKSGWIAIKDFTDVVYNNQHIVYMSTVNTSGSYGGGMMTFSDWPGAATATQSALSVGTVAPTLFYFSPKNIWVLAYEWGSSPFSYLTSTDPTSASSWSSPHALFTGSISGS